jgi:serpin B
VRGKIRKQMSGLATVLVLFLVVGCAGAAKGAVLQSDKPRLASDATGVETAELVAANSAFAFDLYQALRQRGDENLFYSPYSISLALAMTYVGARGETEQQMADTLRFPLSQERLHPTFNGLDLALARRGEGAKGDDEKGARPGRQVQGFQLNIANSIWGQKGHEFLPTFLDVLAEHYGAGLRTLDFAQAPEEARVTINNWVSDQTEDRIKDLIPPGLIPPSTRLVLANAIYFNAAWSHPFEKRLTRDGTFYLLDGNQVTVPMMEQTERFRYAQGGGYQAIELSYKGGEMAMLILLPEAGQFEEFESTLDAERVAGIVQDLAPSHVALVMPKFKFDSDFELRKVLSEMGMPGAFTDEVADFSGMDGTRGLYISEVVHKAFVAVDEAGTEAAAATVVIIVEQEAPGSSIEITVDRPFVFLIRDMETGAILFLGRVVDPSM